MLALTVSLGATPVQPKEGGIVAEFTKRVIDDGGAVSNQIELQASLQNYI